MSMVLIITVLAAGQISAAYVDYPTPVACEQHRAAVLRDPVMLPGKDPIVVAVCRKVDANG